jgi:uncharacterized protein YbjT (DUF2867 family)
MPAHSILITGATGHQGGATARALVGQGFALYAMTRKPDSPAARELAELGITIVQGDLDDEESLKRLLEGKWGVFAVQNSWEAGVEHEAVQGHRIASLARQAGVSHYVYNSVGSADHHTGIPHFESKWRIEETVRTVGFPSYVILRPVFFMENLVTPALLQGDKLMLALSPETEIQMIAVQDIGRHAARAFLHSEQLNMREIELAGDSVTMPAAARALSEGLGHPVEFVQLALDEVRRHNEDVALNLEWLERVGYSADIGGLEQESGIHPLSLVEWARERAPVLAA